MTGRRLIGPGSGFEARIGCTRAIVDGGWVSASEAGGFDAAGMTSADIGVEAAARRLRSCPGGEAPSP